MEITRELAKFNHIKFHDKEHKYYINDKQMTSVTKIIGNFKQAFDSDYWANKKATERGILKEEILKEVSSFFSNQKRSDYKYVYEAIDKIKTKSKEEPITIFNEAINNIRPIKCKYRFFWLIHNCNKLRI